VHETDVPLTDGEVVWFWHLDADAKLSGAIRAATATKSPIAGKSTKETVKTIAQGVPDRGSTCGDYARVLLKFAREAVGASFVLGIPCALFTSGCGSLSNPGRIRAAGMRRCVLRCLKSRTCGRGPLTSPSGEGCGLTPPARARRLDNAACRFQR
jgi:hypothetical protein